MDELQDLFEVSLDDVMLDIDMAGIEEEVKELAQLEAVITEAEETLQLLNDIEYGVYSEDVVMKGETNRKRFKSEARQLKNRTANVGKGALKTYWNVTKAGGNLIHATAMMLMKIVDAVVRTVTVISDKLVKLPDAIGRFADKCSRVIPRIKNSIKGHLNVHIRVETISELYDNNIFVVCNDIINDAKVLADGDTWVTWINFLKKKGHDNDIKIAKRLDASTKKLESIEINEVTINLNDKNNVAKYFSSTPNIVIRTHGENKKYTYFQALQRIAEDLKTKQKNIKAISKQLDSKLNKTQVTQEFARLSDKKRNTIESSVKSVSRSIMKIENIGKFVIKDINTMHKFIQECINDTKKTAHRNQIRDEIRKDPSQFQKAEMDSIGPKPKDPRKVAAWEKRKRAIEKEDVTKGGVEGRNLYSSWEDFTKSHEGY